MDVNCRETAVYSAASKEHLLLHLLRVSATREEDLKMGDSVNVDLPLAVKEIVRFLSSRAFG